MRKVLALAAAIFLAAPGVYFVFKFAESLSTFEKVASIVFPVLLGFAFYFISNWSMERALFRERTFIEGKIDTFLSEAAKDRVVLYSTKKTVPNGSDYWNSLAKSAEKRLIIVGTTNKSWFNKEDGQSKRLLGDFGRIKSSGGSVDVVSIGRRQTVDMMQSFVRKHLGVNPKKETIPFSYATVTTLNYGAILSDKVLVLMPIPFEESFREETAVIEIRESEHPQVFKNYLSDIERLLGRANGVDLSVAT